MAVPIANKIGINILFMYTSVSGQVGRVEASCGLRIIEEVADVAILHDVGFAFDA